MGAERIGQDGHDDNITRRRALSAAGLAAVAVPLAVKGTRVAPTAIKTAGDVAQGPGYLYRPGQVLVEDGQAFTATVVSRLRKAGAAPHEELTVSAGQAGLPVRVFQVPGGTDIPGLVDRLRQHAPGESIPNVGPNHVFTGQYDYQGGAADDPQPTAKGSEYPDLRNPAPGAPRIAILDTGYDPAVRDLHPGLAERLVSTAADAESPLTRNGYLATEAGHGTFIAGIVMRLAPEVRIRQVRVLDPSGMGDDLTAALGLARANAPVVNLSLGGYTHGGMAPVALAAALRHLDDSVAVVAAAGNNASSARFWPAAFPRVVAVGALDTTAGTTRRASFSDYGSWVDVYAPGVDVHSTYLDGSYLEAGGHVAHLDGWARWSGTSFAAPQVAAQIARRVQGGVAARQAARQVLASATWLAGVGPVLIP